MKEAPNSPYNKCIFRETFSAEQTVRNNGGLPTDVTISKGIGSFNGTSSYIKYNKVLNGVYSVRIKVKNINPSGSYTYMDFRNSSGTGTGYVVGGTLTLVGSSGTEYVNGITSRTVNTTSSDIVITGITINCFEIFLNTRYSLTNWLGADVDLVEIYEGVLTPSEVKNLYNNDWNKELVGLNGQINKNIITNGENWIDTNEDNIPDYWNTVGNISINLARNNILLLDSISSDSWLTKTIFQDVGAIQNKSYTIKMRFIGFTPGEIVFVRVGSTSTIGNFTSFTTTGGWQEVQYTGTANANGGQIIVGNLSWNGVKTFHTLEFDYIRFYETTENILLDYDSTNGYITDRTGKNTLTPTDVSIKKTGNFYSAEFNGSTSTIVTDSTDPTIWQNGFTLVAWVNLKTLGGGSYGRILDKSDSTTAGNGFLMSIEGGTKNAYLQINAGDVSATRSAVNSVELNKWIFLSLTVNAASQINYYIGDLNNAPIQSGNVNMNLSKTISGITTTNPLTIGNRSTVLDRGFGGKIKMAKAYSGVLSLEDLTQIWSSTRGKVN